MALFRQTVTPQWQSRWTGGTLVLILAGLTPHAALADFPGERWDTPYVQVTGAAEPGLLGAVQSGLKAANETYFYGDRATRMQATVRAAGSVDVRILDARSGAVIAERSGLSYSGTGAAAAQSISRSALAWMDGLGCSDGGCQVATSGGAAPQPAVQVAEAPQPAPVTPKSETTFQITETPTPVPEPEPEPAQIQPVVSQPTSVASVLEQPASAAASTAALDQQSISAPTPQDVADAPTAPAEPEPASPAAKPATTEIAVATPSTGSSSPAPEAASVSLAEPSAGSVAALSGSLVSAPALSSGASSDETTPLAAPDLQEPTPVLPSVPEGAQDADAVLAAAPRSEPAVQNVLPGVVLPLPRPGDAVTPVSALLGAQPDVETQAESAPSGSTELALAEPATTAEVSGGQPSQEPEETQVSIGATDQAAPSPEIAAEEPARATQPATVSGTPSADAPATVGSGDAQGFQSPTPVARAPQSDAATPAAPSAEIAAAAPTIGSGSGAPQIQADDGALAAPSVEAEQPSLATGASGESSAPAVSGSEVAVSTPQQNVTAPEAPATPAVRPEAPDASGDGEQLALANPQADISVPQPSPNLTNPEVPQTAAPAASPAAGDGAESETPPQALTDDDPATEVDVQVAAVDPTASGPTLANARWVGFTPAVYTGSDSRSGAWISGPFDRKQRTGWITDTATGATTRVTFIWREGGSGARTATLSRDAADALGLGQGDVANVAVYLPR